VAYLGKVELLGITPFETQEEPADVLVLTDVVELAGGIGRRDGGVVD
jgi:hypothetical protein